MSYNSEDYFSSKDFKNLLNRFEEGERSGQQTLLDPEDYADIAEYYYNNGKSDYADEIIERAISIYPDASAPLLFKARVALIDHDDPETAVNISETIEDKTDLEYHYLEGEIMLYCGDNDDVDVYFEDCLCDVDEEDKDFYMIDVADIFADYNDIERAEKWLSRSRATDTVEYKELQARIMLERGCYDESEKIINELIDKKPYSTQYWNLLASSQFFKNDIEESIKSSEYSIAINPNNRTALINKGNGLYNLGNYIEALKYFKRYNELSPNDEGGNLLMGLCLLMLEDYENAVANFAIVEKKTAPNSPSLVDIYKDWAWALVRMNHIDESMAILDRAELVGCDHTDMLIYRGSLLIGTDRYHDAKDCFLKAARNSGYSAEVFTKIAITIYESGVINIAYKMFRLLYSSYEGWYKGYPYFAACCYDLEKKVEFKKVFKKAMSFYPEETKKIFRKLFPDREDLAELLK